MTTPTVAPEQLTEAELRLLEDLADAPILKSEADRRRPFAALIHRRLVKHGASRGRPAYALTSAGMALVGV